MDGSATLSSLAEAEIAALTRDGIQPTPAEIVEINALAWAVETPATRRSLARGVPVSVGVVTLWPFTMYAADWVDRVGSKLEVNPWRHPIIAEHLETIVLAYAMAHGYSTAGELDAEGETALAFVLAWAGRLRCTLAELVIAVDQVLGEDEQPRLPDDPNGKPMSVGDFSAFMAAAAKGTTPEFWERRCALSYCFAMLSAIAAQNRADGKPVAGDPKIKAETALGWAVEKVRERARNASTVNA